MGHMISKIVNKTEPIIKNNKTKQNKTLRRSNNFTDHLKVNI